SGQYCEENRSCGEQNVEQRGAQALDERPPERAAQQRYSESEEPCNHSSPFLASLMPVRRVNRSSRLRPSRTASTVPCAMTLPSTMIETWSQTRWIRSRLWLDMTTLPPPPTN